MKHLIDIFDLSAEELRHVLDVSRTLRERRDAGKSPPVLAGQTLLMYFEKPSLRTRVSFEQAMYELGGRAIVIGQDEVKLGVRESVADFTRVVNGMVQGVMARVFEHEKLIDIAQNATVPVVNALSDYSHPCQALADILTMRDEFGDDLTGRSLVFVGDGNNVARSLAMSSARLGMRFTLACPPNYALGDGFIERVTGEHPEADVRIVHDAIEAVSQADAIYADTFVSMGQEDEKQARLDAFAAYQVNESLLAAAPDRAIVLHCLPAYRGVEITDAVMDGPQSRVFPQSHNRLHAQKGLLAVLMGGR